jgi:hypothetical protein
MESALWLKARKRRSQRRMRGKKKKTLDFDKLSKKDMIKIKSLLERLQEQELLLE